MFVEEIEEVETVTPEVDGSLLLLVKAVVEFVIGEVEFVAGVGPVVLDPKSLEFVVVVAVAEVIALEDRELIVKSLVKIVLVPDVVLVPVLFEAVVCAASSAGSGVLVSSTLCAQSFA